MRSEGCIPPPITRTFLALVEVHEDKGRATVREVANAAGRKGLRSTHDHLCRLRALGLVEWQERKAGTLRPLYGRINDAA